MKETKTKIKWIVGSVCLTFIWIFVVTWCCNGGQLSDREFYPDYLTEKNPIIRQEAVEKYNVISGTVTEMEPRGGDNWDLTLESE